MELLVTLVVVGVLVTAAIPGFSSLFASRSMASATSALASDYRLARSAAVQRVAPVTICQSTSGSQCVTTTVGWQGGWIVYTDANGDGSVDSGTDTVLRVQNALTGISSISNATTSSTKISATFRGNGLAVAVNDSLVITPSYSPAGTRLLCVSSQGRVALRSKGDNSC